MADFDYEIIETFEAGIMLEGTEVKSLRTGKANIADSYASDEGGEIKKPEINILELIRVNEAYLTLFKI